jgi:perosamine synthetase
MNIPLCIPSIGKEEIALVEEVLKSGWLAHGPKNSQFEKNFAEYIGVEHAVSLNSCTSALQLALQAQNITGEVIVPSFTFAASANAIVTAGAKPVFVDIEYDSCNIDPIKIKEAISKKTQAIMPVHYAGQSCKMDEIMEIAKKYSLKVIEDSAETVGGTFKGKKTGSFGTGCFSFYPTKNITTGEGGMVTTNDRELAEKVKALRAHGITSTAFEREKKEKPWLRAAEYAGYNYRLCDILAAIGIVQLSKVDKMNELRRKHAEYLTKNLKDIKGIATPVEHKDCRHVYQMYTIKLKDGLDRTRFIQKLKEKGIGATVHFDPPVHEQPFYKNFAHSSLKVTEEVSKTIVTLPMYPDLKKEELDFMIDSTSSIVNGAHG